MKLAFIGLGRMGRGMAHRLTGVGHSLAIYRVPASPIDALVSAGAIRADSVADACRDRDIVITMLVDDRTVLDVALGKDGIRDALPHGSIHVAMGTHGVDAILALTAAHAAAGQRLVAAPVLGRPEMAAQGALGIIAGGDAGAIRDCEPVFERLGRRLFRAGENAASATAIKLANNHLLGCALVAMAEAFSLARAHNVPPALLYDLFSTDGFNGPAYTGYGKTMVEATYDKVGSPVTVGLKDARLIRAAAQHARVPMPNHNVYHDRLLGAVAHGDGDRDQAVLAREQNRAAGIESSPLRRHS